MLLRKKYFYLILFLGSTFFVYAGTPVASIMSAHRQDTLLLGTIENVKNNNLIVKVTYVFPQNKVWFLDVGDSVIIKMKFRKQKPDFSSQKYNSRMIIPEEYRKKTTQPESPSDGKKYLLSLNKETRWFSTSFFYPAWGIFEVEGENYSNMKLVQPTIFEHKELQALINSGGLIK